MMMRTTSCLSSLVVAVVVWFFTVGYQMSIPVVVFASSSFPIHHRSRAAIQVGGGLPSTIIIAKVLPTTTTTTTTTSTSSSSSTRTWFPPRGGGGNGDRQPQQLSAIDFGAVVGFAKSVGITIWKKQLVQDVINTSPAEAVAKVGKFWKNQRAAAERRRKAYSRDQSMETTRTAVLSPRRALRLSLVAFVFAELLQFLETRTKTWGETAETISADLGHRWKNFCNVGRAKGGLLRGETWTNGPALSRALQDQLEPKYQWALGATAGFVLSPFALSLGWTVLGWSAGIYILAEIHHLLKTHIDDYYYSLKKWDNPIIYAVDDGLEDMRRFVDKAISAPKETLLAMRDDIDERIDFDFPPHTQKGLLFGAIVGVITGA